MSEAHKQIRPFHTGQNVTTHIKQNVSLCFELPKVSGVGESIKCRVEDISGEGRHHTTEEDLPGKCVSPERRHFLHGEEQTPHWSPEGRRHPCCGPGRYKISPVRTKAKG